MGITSIQKVRTFFSDLCKPIHDIINCSTLPTIKKPTRVGKNSATVIGHIIANSIVDCHFKISILKTDVTDFFAIAMVLKTDEPIHQSQKVQNVHKINYNESAIESPKQRLRKIDWDEF